MLVLVLRHLPPTIYDVIPQNTTKIRYRLTTSALSSPPAPFSSFRFTVADEVLVHLRGQSSISSHRVHKHFRHFEYPSEKKQRLRYVHLCFILCLPASGFIIFVY
jgi:hypothetical protein